MTDGPKSWPENGRRDIQMVEISYRNVIHKKSLVNPAKAIKVILFSLSFRENERENKES